VRATVRAWADGRRELFDDPAADPATALASLRDIALANRVLGGAAAAVSRLAEYFRAAPRSATLTLLDVGTGDGDIPRLAQRRARREGIRLRLVGLERHAAAARHAARYGDLAAVRADAAALPLRDASVDLVLCSQLLHHYEDRALTALITELGRVARVAVVIADLRPSPIAALGVWLASFPLRFHPVSRRDAVISVRRGFTPEALRAALAAAGVRAEVRTPAGFRVTAAWRPARAPGRGAASAGER
jgi:SAM-dependent methyltransferase